MTQRDLFMAEAGMLLMSLLWVATIFLCPILVRWFSRKKSEKEALGPSNMIGPLVLPIPSDPRWVGDARRRRLGIVEVRDGSLLYIDGRQLPVSNQSLRYCTAVNKARRLEKPQELIKKVDQSVLDDSSINRREGYDDPYGDVADMLGTRKV